MFFIIILLSYVLGCTSTIALLIYLYLRYGLRLPGTTTEPEQFQQFHPLSEAEEAKNPTVNTVNYLFQFFYQEVRETSKLRRYIMKKLHFELNELKNTALGKLFLRDIVIQSFSLGKECPIFSDIQLVRQERDDRRLIKNLVAKLNMDYKDGFSVVLEITLPFDYKCQIHVKVKRIKGNLRLEFRREPFSHWILVFQENPLIDLEIRAYLSNRESLQLAQIINQQICRVIRRKQTWPNYKVRYQPFFPTSKQSTPTEVLSPSGNNLIPGTFDILIEHCDRLSIPFEIFERDKWTTLPVFLTVNINEQMSEDYLMINRNHWRRKHLQFQPKTHRIEVKEVSYMNRREFLIESLDPIPHDIEDIAIFRAALEEKNIFLLEIENEEVKSLTDINELLNQKSTDDNQRKVQLIVGIPLLNSVRVKRVARKVDGEQIETTGQQSPTTVRRRTTVAVEPSTHRDSSETTESSLGDVLLSMMNADFLQDFQARPTPTRKAEAFVAFGDQFEFHVGSQEQFLNICLWCKPPLGCGVLNAGKKLILLGYATVALSEIVLDAHMSYKRETQRTINFRSIPSPKPVLNDNSTDAERKLDELSKHKAYDANMTHGFVTIRIKHQPAIEMKIHSEEKKEQQQPFSIETVLFDRNSKQYQEQDPSTPKPTDHIFDDHTLISGIPCAYCHKTFWRKSARQCRNCLSIVHKKCEERFNSENENFCPHAPKSIAAEDENSPNRSTTTDSTTRRSFRTFGHKNANTTSTLSLSELSKIEESDDHIHDNISPSKEKPFLAHHLNPTSSKLANVASSAYSKLLEFKTKRLPSSTSTEIKKRRSDSTASENIPEDNLQDILNACLSDSNLDMQGLERLFHEKAVDHTVLYAKASETGHELFRDLPPEERRQKLENELSKLQQEIRLQEEIRNEIIIEFNNYSTDENRKKILQNRISNVDEKVQALGALTIYYCSGLKHCRSQLEVKSDHSGADNTAFSDSDNEQ